jgi:hypothetical protein
MQHMLAAAVQGTAAPTPDMVHSIASAISALSGGLVNSTDPNDQLVVTQTISALQALQNAGGKIDQAGMMQLLTLADTLGRLSGGTDATFTNLLRQANAQAGTAAAPAPAPAAAAAAAAAAPAAAAPATAA